MSKILTIAALFIIILGSGCAVKKREELKVPTVDNSLTSVSGLKVIAGSLVTKEVFRSRSGKFLIHPSTLSLVGGEENTVHYRFSTSELVAVDLAQYSLEFQNDMPSMAMEITPAKVTPKSLGEVAVTYEIAHLGLGHPWRFTIHVKRGEALIDSLVYEIELP